MIIQRRPDIDRFLSGPGPGMRAAVIHGRDRGVVQERAQGLAAKINPRLDDPFDVAVLSEADILGEEDRLEGELMAYSMVGGRRLVRLRIGPDRPAADRLAAEALTGHVDGRFNPDAFFLIEVGPLGRESALRKIAEGAEACGAIACYEDEAADLIRMTREALAVDALSLSAEALDVFVSRLPRERGVARREIERLSLFLGPGRPQPASLDDLSGFFGVEPQASLSEAAFEAFGGRLAATQASLRRAAQEGEFGVAAVRALGLHLGRLRRAAALQGSGTSAQGAAKAVGVFFKSEREFVRQTQAWTQSELAHVQADILAADQACKLPQSPDRLLGERLALSIAGRARRLGL